MPRVMLNGSEQALTHGATVADAVRATGVTEDGRGMAVAVAGEVVPRAQWETRQVQEGEQIEVLHAVQGG